MEESPKQQAHALAVRAREALPQRELAAHQATGVETALSLLARAVERLTDDGPLVVDMDPEVLEQLREQLRDRLGGQGPVRRLATGAFVVSFPDIELSVDEIWPDGGAPELPTPTDVVNVMKGVAGAVPSSVIRDWLLIDSLFVRAAFDQDALGEVEWDGT